MGKVKKGNQKKIDSSKLRRIFEYKGLTNSDVSVALGFDKSYIGKSLDRGFIMANVAILLDSLYGIEYSDYKADEEEKIVDEVINDDGDSEKDIQSILCDIEKTESMILECLKDICDYLKN